MPAAFPPDSVGLVVPQTAHFNEPLALACGRSLPAYDLIYETYGQLNASASNAVLICHALSGHHHAAGYHSADDRKPGWWDSCIGPGKSGSFLGACKRTRFCRLSSPLTRLT